MLRVSLYAVAGFTGLLLSRSAHSEPPHVDGAGLAEVETSQDGHDPKTLTQAEAPAPSAGTVCLSYIWANHGTWCSWYSWTCASGPPLNVDSTHCGAPGSCGSGMPSPAPRCIASGYTRKHSDHPSKNGYGATDTDLIDRKDSVGPSGLQISRERLLKKHVRLTYRAVDGAVEKDETIDAQVFVYKVTPLNSLGSPSSTHPPRIFAVGYQIKNQTATPEEEIPVGEVTGQDDYLVQFESDPFKFNVVLHRKSLKAKH